MLNIKVETKTGNIFTGNLLSMNNGFLHMRVDGNTVSIHESDIVNYDVITKSAEQIQATRSAQILLENNSN